MRQGFRICIFIFLRFLFIYFREREREGEREGEETLVRERNIERLPLANALTGNWIQNPGVRPDREWNQRSFTLRDDAQPTEPHCSGWESVFLLFFLTKKNIWKGICILKCVPRRCWCPGRPGNPLSSLQFPGLLFQVETCWLSVWCPHSGATLHPSLSWVAADSLPVMPDRAGMMFQVIQETFEMPWANHKPHGTCSHFSWEWSLLCWSDSHWWLESPFSFSQHTHTHRCTHQGI